MWGKIVLETTPRRHHDHVSRPARCACREDFQNASIGWSTGEPQPPACCCVAAVSQEKSLVEIIVVDAGCKDNTMAAVASMKLDVKLRSASVRSTPSIRARSKEYGQNTVAG